MLQLIEKIPAKSAAKSEMTSAIVEQIKLHITALIFLIDLLNWITHLNKIDLIERKTIN